MALSIPNRFTNGQTIDAAKFNSNFDAVTTWAATNDATLASAQSDITSNATIMGNIGRGAFLALETAQAIPATAYTTITLVDSGGEAFDTDGWFNAATETYTPLVAGAYQFNLRVQMTEAEFVPGAVNVYITKGSTRHLLAYLHSDNAHGAGASLLLHANGTTDTFKVEAYATAGVTTLEVYFSGYCVKPD